jgi:hypothetical protein
MDGQPGGLAASESDRDLDNRAAPFILNFKQLSLGAAARQLQKR